MRIIFSVLSCMLLAGCLAAAAAGVAAPAVPSDDQWRGERKGLEEMLAARIQGDVQRQLNPRKVAEAMHFPWPVKEPAMPLPAVKEQIAQAVAAEVEKQFPASAAADIPAKAEEKYKLVTVGQEIVFTLRGGVGANATVKGRVEVVTQERLRIDTRWLATRDLDDEVLARLVPEVHKRLVTKQIQRDMKKLDLARSGVEEQAKAKLTPQMMAENGYAPVREVRGTRETVAWHPMKALFDTEMERLRKETEAASRRKLEPEFYKGNGYELYKGEWMPEVVVAARKAALEAEQEAKDAAAEEAAPKPEKPGTAPSQPMPPNMMMPMGVGPDGKPMGPMMMIGPDGKPMPMVGPDGKPMPMPPGMMMPPPPPTTKPAPVKPTTKAVPAPEPAPPPTPAPGTSAPAGKDDIPDFFKK